MPPIIQKLLALKNPFRVFRVFRVFRGSFYKFWCIKEKSYGKLASKPSIALFQFFTRPDALLNNVLDSKIYPMA